MTEPKTVTVPFRLSFKHADPEGTAPLRVVAGHAQRVGEMWLGLADELARLADSFDALTASDAEPETGR